MSTALDDLGVAVDAAVARMTSDKAQLATDVSTEADLRTQLAAAVAAQADEATLVALKDKLAAATA